MNTNTATNLVRALRTLPRRGQHNLAKLLCLAAGLAISSVMIAEIWFEQTFDTWFPHHERTYCVNECILQDGEYHEYTATSGAIATGLLATCPQVEAATRITSVIFDMYFLLGEQEFKLTIPMADSCFFDVFGARQLEGDLRQALSTPATCVVSRSFAQKAGGNVVGRHLVNKGYPDDFLTIGGVYDDFPLNSTFQNTDVIISMSTFRRLGWDQLWVGTDRFSTYVRLRPGTAPDDLRPNIQAMMDAHHEFAEAKKAGVDFGFSLTQMSQAYSTDSTVQRMCRIMALLAAVLLFSTVMNYLLIVIGNMVGRSREMAVRKCFGASPLSIHAIILTEATVHVLLGAALAALLLWLCRGTVESLMSAPLQVLVLNKGAWLLALVVLLIIIIGGVVPGWLFSRIPVSTAFRGAAEARHRWKLALLGFEFAAVGLLLSLLMVVHRQYTMMTHDRPGYSYDLLAVVGINGIDGDDRKKAEDELRRLPGVDMAASCSELPISGHSGNNIYVPGSDKELFNVADQYYVTDDYLRLMDIPIVEGQGFTPHSDSLREVMVDERFVEKMRTAAGWTGSVVGRRIRITEHSWDDATQRDGLTHTICGVYKNHRLGSIFRSDTRPSVLFRSSSAPKYQLVRFHTLSPEAMQQVREAMQQLFPGHEVTVTAYSFYVFREYQPQHSFRQGVMICGLTILVVSLIGLVGYVLDEVGRRRKEIAIRKVNGATLRDVLRLFVRDILLVAVPALLVGALAAWLIAREWLQMFSERVSLAPQWFLGCILLLLVVIIGVVVANCWRVARSNPVDYLKAE